MHAPQLNKLCRGGNSATLGRLASTDFRKAPARQRLVEAVAGSTKPGVLALGGAGWGKTHLAQTLIATHGGCLVDASVSSTIDALRERTEAHLGDWTAAGDLAQQLDARSAVLAIDRVDSAPTELVEFLADVANQLSAGAGLVLTTARVAPPQLSQWQIVDMPVLAFTEDEIADLLADLLGPNQISTSLLLDMTAGWPAAVVACLDYLASSSDDPNQTMQRLMRRPLPVDTLITDTYRELADADVQVLSILARMSTFNEATAAAAGAVGLTERARESGVPVLVDGMGWMQILKPHATHLASIGGVTEVSFADILSPLIDDGRLSEALKSSLALGAHDNAANLVATLTIDEALTFQPNELVAAITAIGDSALVHPRCLQVTAQCLAVAGRPVEGMPLLERAADHLSKVDPDLADPTHLELLTELGVWQLYLDRFEEATRTMKRCEQALPPSDEGRLRAGFLDLRGLLGARGNDTEELLAARSDMADALALWRQLGDARSAVVTGMRLANNVLLSLGRRDEALSLFDSLDEIGNVSLLDRGRIALYSGMMMPFVGRAHEVADRVQRARELGSTLDLSWMTWWADWAEAVAASTLGDAERVDELATHLEADNALITSPVTTAVMWADLAEAAARCGLDDTAVGLLGRSRSIGAASDWFLHYAEASVAARVGDPAEALAKLETYLMRPDAEPERKWFAELLLARAHQRLENYDDATKHLASARSNASDLGQPQLLGFMEAALLEQLEGIEEQRLEQTTTGIAGSASEVAAVEIRVFGDFAVHAAGAQLAVPGGRTTTLLKLLAVHRGRILVDQAIDVMWPDADLEVGRRRLRNVVRRVRQRCGDILERNGDAIALASHVTTDYEAAHRALALASERDATHETVRHATELWRSSLLADNRYDDWAEDARNEQRSARQRLLRELIARSDALGEPTAALTSELGSLSEH